MFINCSIFPLQMGHRWPLYCNCPPHVWQTHMCPQGMITVSFASLRQTKHSFPWSSSATPTSASKLSASTASSSFFNPYIDFISKGIPFIYQINSPLTYQHKLFFNVNPIYMPIACLCESTICHEGVILPFYCVIQADYDGVIHLCDFVEIVCNKVVEVELAFFKGDYLAHSFFYAYLLKVIFFIRSIKHDRRIISISLLLYTTIDSNVCSHFRVNFKWDLQFMIRSNFLKIVSWIYDKYCFNGFFVYVDCHFEWFKLSVAVRKLLIHLLVVFVCHCLRILVHTCVVDSSTRY